MPMMNSLLCITSIYKNHLIWIIKYSNISSLNAYFPMPEIKDQSLVCSLDSCDVRTRSGFDLPSLCVCPVLPAVPILAASVHCLAQLRHIFWPTSDDNTSVLLWPTMQMQWLNVTEHETSQQQTETVKKWFWKCVWNYLRINIIPICLCQFLRNA